MQIGNVLAWQKRTGEAVVVRGLRIIPESLVLMLRLPFAGYVWNWPIGLLVEHDGDTERIPIIDITRIGQWVLSLWLVLWVMALARKRRGERE